MRVAQRCSEALELGVAVTSDPEVGLGGGGAGDSVWRQLDRAKEVLAQGYLYKKKRGPPGQHTWVTRWFVLRADDCLYSFKSENVRNKAKRD